VNLGHHLRFLDRSLLELAEAFSDVAQAHHDEPDVRIECTKFAEQTARQRATLVPFLGHYDVDDATRDVDQRAHRLFQGTRDGPLGLIRDLHDLFLMTCECEICWTLIQQAAQGARDADLTNVAQTCRRDTELRLSWLRSRMKQGARCRRWSSPAELPDGLEPIPPQARARGAPSG